MLNKKYLNKSEFKWISSNLLKCFCWLSQLIGEWFLKCLICCYKKFKLRKRNPQYAKVLIKLKLKKDEISQFNWEIVWPNGEHYSEWLCKLNCWMINGFQLCNQQKNNSSYKWNNPSIRINFKIICPSIPKSILSFPFLSLFGSIKSNYLSYW